MKFFNAPLILTMSAIVAIMSTSCNAQDISSVEPSTAPAPAIQDTTAPKLPMDTEDHPRVTFSKVSKVPYTSLDSTTQMSQTEDNTRNDLVKRRNRPWRLVSEHSETQQGFQPIQIRRIAPRRLAGERRQLLGDLVNQVAPPKAAPAPAPSPSPPPASPADKTEPEPAPAQKSEPQPVSEPEPVPEPESTTTTTTTTTTSATSTTTKGDSKPTPEKQPDETANISSSDDNSKEAQVNLIVNQPTKSAVTDNNHLQGINPTKENNSNPGITIGFVMAAIVIAGVIGVWVFRKWKLEPSKQFKDRMTGTAGGAAAAGVYDSKHPQHNDTPDYDGYGGIYGHDPAALPPQPLMEHVGASPSIAAAVMVPPQAVYQQPHHAYGYHNEEYDNQYNGQDYNPHHLPQQEYNQEFNQEYNPEYNQNYNQDYSYAPHDNYPGGYQEYSGHQEFPQYPQARPTHMSMSSVPESMTDYGPYGSGPRRPSAAMSSSSGHPGHNIHKYGSEDYSMHDNQFLRELRE